MHLILKAVRRKIGQIFSFKELIRDKKDRYDIVVTFLSLLEMAKERVIRVEQQTNYGDISVSAGERINEDTVLESYAAAADAAGEGDGSEETFSAQPAQITSGPDERRNAQITGEAEERDDK